MYEFALNSTKKQKIKVRVTYVINKIKNNNKTQNTALFQVIE